MSKHLTVSEIIFKVVAYTFMTIFSLFCLYPFVYSVSAALSGRAAFMSGEVVLLPVDVQFEAFEYVFNQGQFWVSYSNTLFVTFLGTAWALFVAILGAYALSKRRLAFRRVISFFLVFTLWFSAGMIAQWLNYKATQEIFDIIGLDDKMLVVIAMGMAAFNIILLRNTFEGVPKEIEEAAIVDGANEFQVLFKVYLPMSKATLATVGLFFAISRWNGYFWARTMTRNPNEWPLQVFIRQALSELGDENAPVYPDAFAPESFIYAMIVCSIIPILIVYPYISKYFARGVNVGGVKE